MSRRIPLFPLPGVVLLPGMSLPLHIFEPRYRALVSDALASDQTIGMAMMKAGSRTEDGQPAIYAIGGAGEIVESEELPDGRYNIVLEGRFRYRVLREAKADPYRTASVEEMTSLPFAHSEEEFRITRRTARLFATVRDAMELPPLPEEAMTPERMASEIALRLRYTPEELQAILETDSVPVRFRTLLARMLEWQRRIRFLKPFRPRELDVTRN